MPVFLKTSTAAANPVPLSTVVKNFSSATLIACKGLDGPTASPNTGTIKIGSSPNANEQPLEMAPGDERAIPVVAGKLQNFQQFFLKVANDGDGVVVDYR